jgi:hypothetical protein
MGVFLHRLEPPPSLSLLLLHAHFCSSSDLPRRQISINRPRHATIARATLSATTITSTPHRETSMKNDRATSHQLPFDCNLFQHARYTPVESSFAIGVVVGQPFAPHSLRRCYRVIVCVHSLLEFLHLIQLIGPSLHSLPSRTRDCSQDSSSVWLRGRVIVVDEIFRLKYDVSLRRLW